MDILTKETIFGESCQDTPSNCSDVTLTRRVIPETVTMATLECDFRGTGPSVHEPLLQMAAEHLDATINETTAVRTSILDDFI